MNAKTLIYLIAISIILPTSFADEDSIHCQEEKSVCELSQIPELEARVSRERRKLYAIYNNQSFENIDRDSFNRSVDKFISKINRLRKCQEEHNQFMASCNFRVRSKKDLSSDIFEYKEEVSLYSAGSNCIKSKDLGISEITTSDGKRLLSAMRGLWSLDENLKCKTKKSPIEETDRSFIFSDRRENESNFAGILILDWTDNERYKVSNHWGRKVKLNEGKLSRTVEDDLLIFKWSNGPYVKISPETGKIVESNLLSDKTISKEGNCDTNSVISRNRRRFFPNVKIKSPFDKTIKVKTVTN